MVHSLRLDNYSPTPRKLVLGTNSSFGTESIKIERGAGWDGLALTATWHIPGREEPLRVALLDGDAMDVPPEVTKEARDGVLVLAGLGEGVQRASCNVEYLILEQAGVYGGQDAEPTPELAAQVLAAALQAKADAEGAAQEAAEAKARAEEAQAASAAAKEAAEAAAADAAKAGPYAEAALAAQQAAEDARDKATAAQQAAENAAAAAAASKSAADTLAAEASRAALAAEESKAAANAAANLAGENATAAQQAAGVSTAAANDAGQSASDAAASKAAAETAAQAAQEAQAAAAAARADAVKAQTAAQAAAKTAQDAQSAAEKARGDAQTARQGAEAARDAAAGSAEAAAKSEENAKQSADTLAGTVENVAANTAAVAELREKKAEIDDSAVGADAWSSKHIIDKLCPKIEESGNPVQCYPVAGYPLGVTASWEPVQEGEGEPYPAGGGKNTIPFPSNSNSYPQSRNGLTVEAKDGAYIVNGTATADTYFSVCNLEIGGFEDFGNFALSGCPAGGSTTSTYYLALYTGEKWYADIGAGTAGQLNTIGSGARIEITIKAGYTASNLTFRPQLEKGTTATAWAPYENIRPIVGRDSVTVNLASGVKNWRLLTLTGTETWTFEYTSVSEKYGFVLRTKDIQTPTSPGLKGQIVCNKYATRSANDTYTGHIGISVEAENNKYFRIYDETYADKGIDAWKAYLAAQYAAGTPVQVAYKLAAAPIVPEDGGIYFAEQPAQSGSGDPRPDNVRLILLDSAVQDGGTSVLTLPETIYGGSVDAVSGEGQETWKIITIDAKEIKFSIRNNNNVYWNLPDHIAVGVTHNSKIVCSHFISTAFSINEKYEFIFTQSTNLHGLFSNVDELNDYCAAQYAAGTPVQIAYQLLKEPVPFTATGGAALPALAGVNTVITDADSVDVTGRADPIKRIEDLEAAVASIN